MGPHDLCPHNPSLSSMHDLCATCFCMAKALLTLQEMPCQWDAVSVGATVARHKKHRGQTSFRAGPPIDLAEKRVSGPCQGHVEGATELFQGHHLPWSNCCGGGFLCGSLGVGDNDCNTKEARPALKGSDRWFDGSVAPGEMRAIL